MKENDESFEKFIINLFAKDTTEQEVIHKYRIDKVEIKFSWKKPNENAESMMDGLVTLIFLILSEK